MKRILYTILILLLLSIIPWQTTIAFLFAGMFFFRNYYEGLGGFVLLDVMYAVSLSDGLIFAELWFSAVGCVAFLISIIVKRNLLMYAS